MANTIDRHERLAELFGKYSDLLYRIALVRLQNREDAEDAVQEAFIKYISSPFVYSSDSEEKAWFVRVLENGCRDILRRRSVRDHVSLDDVHDLSVEDEVASGVFDSISRLHEKYRTVILLHYLEGFTVEEISKSLSLSKSAVKMRLLRGREELSSILGKENLSV